MSIFDELQTSLQEAAEIKQGKAHTSRITRHEVVDRLARKNLVDTWNKIKSTAR